LICSESNNFTKDLFKVGLFIFGVLCSSDNKKDGLGMGLRFGVKIAAYMGCVVIN